jgi:hypothetical protein
VKGAGGKYIHAGVNRQQRIDKVRERCVHFMDKKPRYRMVKPC